jgi:hypothetical protein
MKPEPPQPPPDRIYVGLRQVSPPPPDKAPLTQREVARGKDIVNLGLIVIVQFWVIVYLIYLNFS